MVIQLNLKIKISILAHSKKSSNLRPNKLFTVDKKVILYKIGKIHERKLNEVIEKITDILKN